MGVRKREGYLDQYDYLQVIGYDNIMNVLFCFTRQMRGWRVGYG